MRGPRVLRLAAPAVALLVGLTAGCARDHGTAAAPSSSAPSSSATGSSATGSSATGSGLADMQKKVSAAESAAAAADRDAAQDGSR
ncbi:hypothetical protein AAW14_26265 [Streptomyces hygroscopicus]|uniref:hypothetical protein n=1 Tax=Streptomyces hygroscopicus TaxID=1912 RepID=UPI00223F2F8D|nr:hypothetical protein [Streptomyces hygroscopicus]MCW7945415.1 hypothetical protein [Streptomyces hygroscopicus]